VGFFLSGADVVTVFFRNGQFSFRFSLNTNVSVSLTGLSLLHIFTTVWIKLSYPGYLLVMFYVVFNLII